MGEYVEREGEVMERIGGPAPGNETTAGVWASASWKKNEGKGE